MLVPSDMICVPGRGLQYMRNLLIAFAPLLEDSFVVFFTRDPALRGRYTCHGSVRRKIDDCN